MANPFDDADATLRRGDQKQMNEALAERLKRGDPKGAKARQRNSAGHCRNLNYLEKLPLLDLLKCACRRLAREQERVNARERQARKKQRDSRCLA